MPCLSLASPLFRGCCRACMIAAFLTALAAILGSTQAYGSAAGGRSSAPLDPTPSATPSACWENWSLVASPNPITGTSMLAGIAVVSANDVWSTGFYGSASGGQTLAEHWDGSAWSIVPSPSVEGVPNALRGAAAVASNDVWAVGSAGSAGLIEHWDGAQ